MKSSSVTRFADRLLRARTALEQSSVDGVLITPGPDLQYLIGYDAVPLERITCLVLTSVSEPVLIVPRLELLAAQASPVGALGIEVSTWDEADDPYGLIADALPAGAGAYGVDDRMWAAKVLGLRGAMPHRPQVLAGAVINPLRMRKDADEVTALLQAGAAIDRVHAGIPQILRAGMTEAQAGSLIGELILAEGHTRVDFVIVAAGANGASPHHEVSDHVIAPGEPIVIDIGGTMPGGYRSDSTRVYCIGEPDAQYRRAYGCLQRAQAATVAAVRPGVTIGELDSLPRQILAEEELAEFFIHRTGHGIGLETHEEPYLMMGSDLVVEPGMAFSVEPGFYLPGRYGARIEDIVVCTDDGVVSANNQPHEIMCLN
jgi:Xaa-Pro aminopeptidase